MAFWPREKIERIIRRTAVALSLGLIAVWFSGRVGLIAIPPDTLAIVQNTWLVFFWIELLLRSRARRLGEADPALDEPPPATILTILILLTGADGVYAASKGGPEASTSVPYLIAVGTILLAILGFTLASRHKGQIGEARFRTPPEQP